MDSDPKTAASRYQWKDGDPLQPVGCRVEWLRSGGLVTGYVREHQERGGWPIYSVRSNGRVYRVLPQDVTNG